MIHSEFAPQVFVIETSFACNLSCPECAIGGGMIVRRGKGTMKFEKFRIIADKVQPYAKYILLHLWGEPMLNTEIFEIIRYASKICPTNISTNANTLDEAACESLILSGVTDIIISIDGYTQEVYEKYREGGDISKVLENLEYLVFYKKVYSAHINLIPQFIVFEHNQHEMESFNSYLVDLGLYPRFKAPYFRNRKSRYRNSDLTEYIRHQYEDVNLLKSAMTTCVNASKFFTITLDGNAILCCHDYNNFAEFGNVFEQDIMEIWNNPTYSGFRKDIINGNAPDFCVSNCMGYNLQKSIY